jgi:hypothetical protein
MKVERCGLRWTVQDEAFDIWNAYEIDDWCTEQFGRQTWCDTGNLDQRGWCHFNKHFNFMQQDDLTLFLLRWGDNVH